MARPIKVGLDYFPFDVDFFSDIKIRRIIKACGPAGCNLLICLLCNIYRNGYYIEWNEDMPFVIAEQFGVAEGAVGSVVEKALQVGFFDENIYEKYKVLTSKGIQKRYRDAKRKPIMDQYLVHSNGVIAAETPVMDAITQVTEPETPIMGDKSTQSKGKESKVKEEEDANASSLPGAETAPAPPAVFEIVLNDKTLHPVYQHDLDRWKELYPSVDISSQLRKIVGWCEANPKRRKTKNGVKRFINSWLAKEQDKGGSLPKYEPEGWKPLD